MLQKRSVVSVVLLSVFTFGIYFLWWFYDTSRALQQEGGYRDLPANWLFVLYLVISPIGGALFTLSAYENLMRLRHLRGLPYKDNNKTLWILMGAIMPIVAVGVIQHQINELLEAPQYHFYNDQNNFYNNQNNFYPPLF